MPQSNAEKQSAYRARNQQRTDDLVLALCDVVTAYQSEGTETERLAAIEAALGERAETLLAKCDEHLAYATDNAHEALLGSDNHSNETVR